MLVVDDGFEIEAKNRLARIGFDGSSATWPIRSRVMVEHPGMPCRRPASPAPTSSSAVAEVADLQIVDVRNPGELACGTTRRGDADPGRPAAQLVDELDPDRPTVVFCAGGYRSSVAASVLRQAGFNDVSDIIGGYSAWMEPVA